MVRSRWKWFLLGAVVLLAAAELALNALKTPVALVRVVNRGDYPITDLSLSTGASRTSAVRVEPGQSEVFQMGSRGKAALVLKFHQFDNPLSGFEVPDFDARRQRRDGSVLVLEVRPNEVVRYHEPDDTPGRWERIGARVRDTLDEAKLPDTAP
jgi:hypothetical protein